MKNDLVPGVSVTLRVEGRDLKEYSSEEEIGDDDRKIVRYVEAVPGAYFTVKVKFDDDTIYLYDNIECCVHLDGTEKSRRFKTKRNRNVMIVEGHYYEVNGQAFQRRFCFRDLETSDETAGPVQKSDVKALGVISITLTRVVASRTQCHSTPNIESQSTINQVHEKVLKGRALSARASIGNQERAQPCNWYTPEYPYGRNPFAVFDFKYRTRRDLQIESLIERSPSPVPLEDRDPDTLSVEELRQLLELRNNELSNFRRVKAEKRNRSVSPTGSNDSQVKVVDEHPVKRPRTSNNFDAMIDLTDD